jgi:putative ABC transport system permease protein
VAQRLLGRDGQVDRLLVLADQPLTSAPGRGRPRPGGARGRGGSDLGRLTDSFHLNLTAFGLLSFAVGCSSCTAPSAWPSSSAARWCARLRALGVPLRRLIALMAPNWLVLALVAGAMIGVALGYLIAAALLPDVAATLRGLYGADVSGHADLRPGLVAVGLAIALAAPLLAAAGALWRWRGCRCWPARNRAPGPWRGAGGRCRWPLSAGSGWRPAGALALWGRGLIAGSRCWARC